MNEIARRISSLMRVKESAIHQFSNVSFIFKTKRRDLRNLWQLIIARPLCRNSPSFEVPRYKQGLDKVKNEKRERDSKK